MSERSEITLVTPTFRRPKETAELLDNFSKQTEQSLSSGNGNFYFPLQADKLYTIQLLNPNGALICSKNISTVNRLQPEILQVLLSVPAVK